MARLVTRRTRDDRVAQWLAAAIVVNLAAFVASTQAADVAGARQVIAVLPFGAVLAARVFGARAAARRGRAGRVVAAVIAAVLLSGFAVQASTARAAPAEAAGPPVQQIDLKRWTILVYDHNILPALPRHQRP